MTTVRIDMRIDREIKTRAERTAALLGFPSLTAYVTKLMDDDTHRILARHETMTLENDVFDRFVEACLNPPAPNEALKSAVDEARADGLI